jgi:molybdopterin/thiamine biosynthesis adenylyltransferase
MSNLNQTDGVEIDLTSESPYHRQELITWWDQKALLSAKVLVVGAGALGNEIVKNLALVGVGNITIVDMDIIEHTNLARCVFFRRDDELKLKAEVLAREASRMNTDVKTEYFTSPIQELGDAFLLQFDLILAGLDNREARVWLGAAAKRTGKVWIDAAIEGLMGKVQTFVPDGPCYACTMGDKDWEALTKRLSCKLLGVEEMEGGHAPTNATTSSIIAGIQTQEAIKYLVGKSDFYALENKVWRMLGEQMATFTSVVEISDDCPFHYDFTELSGTAALPKTMNEIWSIFDQPENAVLSFYDDFITIDQCPGCSDASKFGYKDLMKKQGTCQSCDITLTVNLSSRVSKSDDLASASINANNWPMQTLVEFKSDSGIRRYRLDRSN